MRYYLRVVGGKKERGRGKKLRLPTEAIFQASSVSGETERVPVSRGIRGAFVGHSLGPPRSVSLSKLEQGSGI